MRILEGMSDRRKKQWLWTALAVAFLGLLLCGGLHVCQDGHLAHPPYHWYSLALDFVWAGVLVLLALAAGIEYRRWRLAGLLVAVCLSRLVLMGSLSLLLFPLEIAALVTFGRRVGRQISHRRIVEKPAPLGQV
jgi:cell division protein FtsW (lipid II flippase)